MAVFDAEDTNKPPQETEGDKPDTPNSNPNELEKYLSVNYQSEAAAIARNRMKQKSTKQLLRSLLNLFKK